MIGLNFKGFQKEVYTHMNFLSDRNQQLLQNIQLSNQTRVKSWSTILGLGGFIVTQAIIILLQVFRISPLIPLSIRKQYKFSIPMGLIAAFSGAMMASAWTHNDFIKASEIVLRSSTDLPFWASKQSVIDPKRMFFELDDSNGNKPNIFYNGITGETVKRYNPDFILGPQGTIKSNIK